MSVMSKEQQELRVSVTQLELENMLGDALGEANYLRTNQEIGIKAVQLLQRKANLRSKEAEKQLDQLKSSHQQKDSSYSGQLLKQEFQLSRTKLECLHWKRRAALLQLKLDSTLEDCQQFKRANTILVKRLSEVHAQLCASQNSNKELKDALRESADRMTDQKRLTEEAQVQVANALSNAGADKYQLRADLLNATTEIATLKWDLQQCHEKLETSAKSLEDAELDKTEKQKKTLEEISNLQAAIAKAESIGQERVHSVNERAKATEAHLKELLAVQRTERESAEGLWKGRVSDLQAQIDQMKNTNERLHAQIASTRAEATQAAMRRVLDSSSADDAQDEAAAAAMSQVSDLVEHMYNPSPEASPVKAKRNPKKQDKAVVDKLPEVFEPVFKVPKKPGNAAKPRQTKKLQAAEPKDPYAMEASPEKPAKEPANQLSKPPGLPAPADLTAAVTTDPKAEVPEQKTNGTTSSGALINKSEEQTRQDAPQPPLQQEEKQHNGNGRPQRVRRQTQPYWIGTTATPATLSPGSSVPDQDDADDPSFTMGLSRPANNKPAPPGPPPAPIPNENLQEASQQQVVDDTAMLPVFNEPDQSQPESHLQNAPQAADKGHIAAAPQEELKGRKRPAGKGQGKAAGKKSRLGPHAQPKAVDEPPVPAQELLKLSSEDQIGASGIIGQANDAPPAATEKGMHDENPGNEAVETLSQEEAQAGTRKSGRPVGISKIDLRTVWGSKTPMPGSEAEALQAANLNQKAARQGKQAASHTVADESATNQGLPDKEGSVETAQPGSKLEAAPIAALNPRVIEAAKQRQQAQPAQAKLASKLMPPPPPPGTRRSQLAKPNGAKQATHKRKLQPSTFLSEETTRDLLLGPIGGFRIPKLKKLNP